MGAYLIKDEVLQPPLPTPQFRRTASGILLVNVEPGAGDPWAIGTGGDASNYVASPSLYSPAPNCEMRFFAWAPSATISFSAYGPFGEQLIVVTYDQGLSHLECRTGGGTFQKGLDVGPVLGEVWALLRCKDGVFSLIGDDGTVYGALAPADYLGALPVDVVQALQPTAFGASSRVAAPGHTDSGDMILDVFYDGIPGDVPASGFWANLRGCEELV